MFSKNKPKKLTLDEMPVLKKAVEILNQRGERLNLGGCMVSNNILTGEGKLRFCYRHEPRSFSPVDNGWEFCSDVDTEEFLNVSENWTIIAWDQMAIIEPSIMEIFDLPAGTDLVLVEDNANRYYCDAVTYQPVVRYCPDEGQKE